MKNKIAIIGASGFIGHHLTTYLSKKFDNILTPSKSMCDITDYNKWESFLVKNNPDFLILLAGSKDVKELELDWDNCYKINTKPIIDYINIVKKHKLNTKLIYFSSDYVFDGIRGGYSSSDEPNPKTNYGKSKFESEKILQNSNIHYKIIRTSAVMGSGGVFYEWLTNALKTQTEIDMFENVYFTPTDINILIEKIYYILLNYKKIKKNIIHIVGDKSYSRYQYACELKSTILNAKAKIIKSQLDIQHSIFCKNLTMISDEI